MGLADDDRRTLANYALGRLGQQYDMKNIFDLARYLFPTPPVPVRYREKMLASAGGQRLAVFPDYQTHAGR